MKFGPKTFAVLAGLGQMIYGIIQAAATKDYTDAAVGISTGLGTIAAAYSGPKPKADSPTSFPGGM